MSISAHYDQHMIMHQFWFVYPTSSAYLTIVFTVSVQALELTVLIIIECGDPDIATTTETG